MHTLTVSLSLALLVLTSVVFAAEPQPQGTYVVESIEMNGAPIDVLSTFQRTMPDVVAAHITYRLEGEHLALRLELLSTDSEGQSSSCAVEVGVAVVWSETHLVVPVSVDGVAHFRQISADETGGLSDQDQECSMTLNQATYNWRMDGDTLILENSFGRMTLRPGELFLPYREVLRGDGATE